MSQIKNGVALNPSSSGSLEQLALKGLTVAFVKANNKHQTAQRSAWET